MRHAMSVGASVGTLLAWPAGPSALAQQTGELLALSYNVAGLTEPLSDHDPLVVKFRWTAP